MCFSFLLAVLPQQMGLSSKCIQINRAIVIGDVMITPAAALQFASPSIQTHKPANLSSTSFRFFLAFECKQTHSRSAGHLFFFLFPFAIKLPEQDIQLVFCFERSVHSETFRQQNNSNDFLIFLAHLFYFLICQFNIGLPNQCGAKNTLVSERPKNKKKRSKKCSNAERVYLLSERVIEFNRAEKTFNLVVGIRFSFFPSFQYFKDKKAGQLRRRPHFYLHCATD